MLETGTDQMSSSNAVGNTGKVVDNIGEKVNCHRITSYCVKLALFEMRSKYEGK